MLTFLELLNLTEKFLIATFLAYASYQDIKKRTVDDKVWICMLVLLLPFSIIILFNKIIYLTLYITSLVIALILGFSIGYLGLMGGADAKAIMVLGALVVPEVINPFNIPSLAIFTNSVIFSLATVFYIIFKNLKNLIKGTKMFDEEIPLRRKILLFITSYKEKVKTIKKRPYAYLIVERRYMQKRIFKVTFKVEEEDTTRVLDELIKEGVTEDEYIWVSPAIPMIVYILIGYIYYIIAGNILYLILQPQY